MRFSSGAGRRGVTFWGACVGLAFAGAWALNLVWWGLLSPSANPRDEAEIIIPAGTGAALANGAAFLFVPASLDIGPGGTLHIENRDQVVHVVGGYRIAPGEGVTITAPEASRQFNCTIHPSGYLGLSITRRPPLWSTIPLALLLGLPMGAITGAAIRVASNLNTEDCEPSPA
jgi:plastocyanin